eukprot:scaffold58196_cov36-Prasinocladus_malaysianus.AAC.1
MQVPQGAQGVCYNDTSSGTPQGIIVSKSEECAECQKLSGYTGCSEFGGSVTYPDPPEFGFVDEDMNNLTYYGEFLRYQLLMQVNTKEQTESSR